MRVVVLLLVLIGAAWIWRSQLFLVSRPGDHPNPLVIDATARRSPARFDAVLPAVPVGLEHLRSGKQVVLIHYWAPWERDGLRQIQALDSLRRMEGFESLRVAVVCFDPFPSVARFVGRHRLRVPVLLDSERRLSATLPCPSIPFTYVLDERARIATAQAGEIDWLGDSTRRALLELLSPGDGRSNPVEAWPDTGRTS